MKTLILSMLLCGNAMAMRCGNDIITAGDPAYKVEQECGSPTAQNGTILDNHKDYYYKQADGMTYDLKIVGGYVDGIDMSR